MISRCNYVKVHFNTILVFCLALSIISSASFAWNIPGDVAVCTAANYQGSPQMISDGSSGAIIVWEDSRNGANSDIYAQRVNSSGIPQWSADGIAVCTAANNQRVLQLVSDDSGGAIIVWEDYRQGANTDIFAQRLDSSGFCQWTIDGVSVCTAAYNQGSPELVSDGSGGAIIVWQDARNGVSYDIYAQRLNASGFSQWTTDGVSVCTAAEFQGSPQLVSDGSGGAIIVWQDYRNGNSDLYGQRLNSSGFSQWTTDGITVCTSANYQGASQLVNDGSGGVIIVWQDYRSGNYDLYVQRLDSSGFSQWTTDGVAVCTDTNEQTYPALVSDGSSGTIIFWHDARSGNYDIYGQRFNPSGVTQWTANGVTVCTDTNTQLNPAVVSDGSNGAIIVWQDYRSSNTDIYVQRLNTSGVSQWTTNGVTVCTATNNQYHPILVSDGSGGAIIAWQDYRNGNYDIYAQSVTTDGFVPVELSRFVVMEAIADN